MDTVKMKITPEQAKVWMDVPTYRRALNKLVLDQCVCDILADKWNSESDNAIMIGENGEVVDGNHRLAAIIKANKPVQTMICFNVKPSTMKEWISETPKTEISKTETPKNAPCVSDEEQDCPFLRDTHMVALVNFSIGIYAKHFAKKVDFAKTKETYLANQELFDDVSKVCSRVHNNGHYNRRATILYAIATAISAGVDLDLITEWYQIFACGLYGNAKLRDIEAAKSILNFKSQLQAALKKGVEDRETVVKKAMASIDHYNKNKACILRKGSYAYPLIDIDKEQQKLSI